METSAKSEEPLTLRQKFEQICAANELLMNENALLQDTLSRIPPEQLKAKPTQQRQRYGRGREKEKLLTMQQKLTLANAEIDRLQHEIADRKKKVEGLVDSAKASIDVFQAQRADIQKESFEFRKNVVVEGVNDATGIVKAERVISYFDTMFKEKTTLIGALQLKYQAMKQKQKRATQFEAQSREAGESLEEIDYEQLKIENQLFQEKITQRNRELLTFKLTAVSTQQTLNKKKRDLSQELKDKEWLLKEIESKKQSLTKIDEELRRAMKERDHALNLNKILTARHTEGERPRVLDYIKQKMLVGEMEKAVQTWERKVEIAEKNEIQRRRKERERERGSLSGSTVGVMSSSRMRGTDTRRGLITGSTAGSMASSRSSTYRQGYSSGFGAGMGRGGGGAGATARQSSLSMSSASHPSSTSGQRRDQESEALKSTG
ncbi:putative flagellar associated protein [Monocercomonoides exilis]|uniref:putative flagellar associated protein n=1 Tax=Monocercomonoides exilis TaxID=2049356 RepID=UPI0035598111|nr:putative flagellar associated protein [Monocercomonoides exilis]|eukprot:MONOS_10970.1-p1 / transcript=MONOS_10970.1 / gene=MONOS_10970 / organism=Monocercomonoides_exilis_PA203 / gene_product=flagellar associated protein / transcript_product=flagellar associated protein / location=Mono_scaffold00523:21455-22919(-) / protein_length=433 / sequence_SO=supercontig / SO=protein_coding / is_pseudo=false